MAYDPVIQKAVATYDKKTLANACAVVIRTDQYTALTAEKLKPLRDLLQHDCVIAVVSPDVTVDLLNEVAMNAGGWFKKGAEKKELPAGQSTNAPAESAHADRPS